MSAPWLPLLRRLGWRRLRQEPFRLALTVAGVALGVAVYLAIQLANTSAVRAFRNSLDAIAGKTHLHAAGGDAGIPEELFPKLRAAEGVEKAAPVVQQTAWLRRPGPGEERWTRGAPSQGRAALVLGVDLLGDAAFRGYRAEGALSLGEMLERMADPRGIFITRALARELGVKEGEWIEAEANRRLRFRVRGILQPAGLAEAMEGRVALLDIGVAQEAFERLGRLDRIDLILKDPSRLEEVKKRVEALLPPGVIAERPVRRGEDVEKMLASFRLNLTVLSVIALLVGSFLIFNAMSASVVRRRGEIARLRALGMTARQVALLFAAEAALIGLAGSVLGLGLGILLARGALRATTLTIRNLYAFLEAGRVDLDPLLLGAALAAGTGVALLSGLGPALAAARVAPAEGARELGAGGVGGAPNSRFIGRTLEGALLASAAAFALARLPAWGGVPLAGYLAAALAVAAVALASPALAAGGAALLRRLPGRALWLAAHGLGRNPGRNAVTIASLATAMAMLASLVIMVESFRRTVAVWTEQTLRADLYAAPASRFIKGSGASFAEEALDRVRGIQGVAAVDGFRSLRVPWRGEWISLSAGDFGVLAERGRLLFTEGDSAGIVRRARERGEALVTETFALRFGLKRGDSVRLPAPGGETALRVAGVYYDYTTEGGHIVVDREMLRRVWGDRRLTSMAVYLAPEADRARVSREMERALDPSMVLISNAGLRRRVLEVFDQTFAITYALEGVAVLVALLGVATALSSNVLERRREIGVLRSLGLTRRGVAGAVMGEAGLLGLLSALLGGAAGAALAAILIFVINKQSFGWTIRYGLPWAPLAGYLAVAAAAAFAAGAVPARAAARAPIAQAVREE